MITQLRQLHRPFELSDFSTKQERSDGIGECEQIIKDAGGTVSRDYFITLPTTYEDVVGYAVDYLVTEWDYALESWRKSMKTQWKSVKVNGVPFKPLNNLGTLEFDEDMIFFIGPPTSFDVKNAGREIEYNQYPSSETKFNGHITPSKDLDIKYKTVQVEKDPWHKNTFDSKNFQDETI